MRKTPRLLPLIAVAIGGVAVVRLLGAGPDLFQGARAWAEDVSAVAAVSAAPTRAVPGVCALTPEQLAEQAGISPAELRIIQSLSTRRGELDARDQDFATMLPLMVSAEQKLDAQIQQLNAVKAEVQALLGQADAREQEEVNRLVAVYQAMRPREAANVFTTLNDEVRLPVAAAMRPRALAAILAQMPPAAARELTEKLANRFEASELAARAQAAAQAPAAVAPTETAAAAPPVAQPPAAQTPRPQQAANRPAARPAPRPAPRPAARPPAAAASEAAPAESEASEAAPRQSVD